jgi:hypothetical protein
MALANPRGVNAEASRSFQKYVGRRLAVQMESIDIETIYPHFKEVCQPADPQDLCATTAGRRDREAYTVSASIAEKRHRGGESLHALARQNLREIMVFATGKAVCCRVLGRIRPRRSDRFRARRESSRRRQRAACRQHSVDSRRRYRRARRPHVLAARSARNSSKICFQARGGPTQSG